MCFPPFPILYLGQDNKLQKSSHTGVLFLLYDFLLESLVADIYPFFTNLFTQKFQKGVNLCVL